jgi:putative transposase
MAHSLTSLHTHVVFSTKDRQRLIRPELKSGLLAYIGGIIRELRGKAVIVNGTQDHIHILVKLPPTMALSECMRVVKANSSRWANEKSADHDFGWQTGYSAFTVSTSQMPAVVRYIQTQEEHHRRMSFQEELRALLRKSGIEFAEDDLWN